VEYYTNLSHPPLPTMIMTGEWLRMLSEEEKTMPKSVKKFSFENGI